MTTKNPWKSACLVLSGILLGCGAGVAASARAQPAPGPPPGPAVERYQYYCEKQSPRFWEAEVVGRTNELGAAGWHLQPLRSMGNGDIYCYERRMP